MSEEIREAVQIIEVAYDGIEIAMKVGSGGIEAMKAAIEFIKGMLDYEKSLGKTSIRKLLLKGGELEVLSYPTKNMKKVEKYAKKYGILYSVIPDGKNKTGNSEIIFHSEAMPRIKMILDKIDGKVNSFDDYLKNQDETKVGNLYEFLNDQKKGNLFSPSKDSQKADRMLDGLIEKVGMYAAEKKSVNLEGIKTDFNIEDEEAKKVIRQLKTIGFLDKKDDLGNYKVIMDKEAFQNRLKNYKELTDRIKIISEGKNVNLSDITISKKLIVSENERAIKTRIPGTWGKDAHYIWINKDKLMEIHNGKTILSFLDKEKEYKIYDDENRVIETMKGEKLYSEHYDEVGANVRKRYEKTKKESTVEKTLKTVKTR